MSHARFVRIQTLEARAALPFTASDSGSHDAASRPSPARHPGHLIEANYHLHNLLQAYTKLLRVSMLQIDPSPSRALKTCPFGGAIMRHWC